MRIWTLIFSLFTIAAHAGTGKVIKTAGTDAYLLRNNEKIKINADSSLEAGDKIFLKKGSLHVSILKMDKSETTYTVDLNKVTFSAKQGDYTVKTVKDGADLDVVSGEVVVSSPLIQTFVPEIVKAHEGFTFSQTQKKFVRRRFKKQGI